ncbi:hypothetical protein MKX03_014205, partial [Papaver bracteatum]
YIIYDYIMQNLYPEQPICNGCVSLYIYRMENYPQTVVVCGNCQTVLCQPTGDKDRLTEGCSFRRKGD